MSREPYNWRDDAACARVDGEVWFPNTGESPRPAKAICATCPVTNQCLQWALDTNERYGVYGGLTENERRALRRERAA